MRKFRAATPAGFTLIELLVTISIIIVLVTVSVPLLSRLTQSNKRTQAVNLATAYIANARALAIQARRPAAVVFYEQSSTYASPSNPNQTAVSLAIADPALSPHTNGNMVFMAASKQAPDYMPYGIQVAALDDASGSNSTFIVRTADNSVAAVKSRAIVFDGNGQLIVRNGLGVAASGDPAGSPGKIVGDWNFIMPYTNIVSTFQGISSPGILIYDRREYREQKFSTDNLRAQWLVRNSDIIAVNAYTGNILR